MEVTDRVHILAQGWEVARVVEPIYDLKADKVVMLFGEGVLPDGIPEFEREMLDDLEATERLDIEIREADLYNLDSAVQAFSQAVKDHEGHDVYINVSTGSQIASIAGMMAAQTADATPFYVRSSTADLEADEVPTPEEPVFPAAGEITELPKFELRGPSAEQLRILASLYGADGATKKELIEFAQDEELPFIANTKANSDEGLYRLLESHIIEPLTDGGYVRVEKAGRKKEVSIEQRGIDALAAFPLEDEAIETVESGVDTPEKFLKKWKKQSRYEAISVNPQDDDSWRPFADSQYDSDDDE